MNIFMECVDDFLMAGADSWIAKMVERIKTHFQLGKIEENDFLYCGYRVKQEAGQITMDQREYAAEIPNIVITPERKRENDKLVTEVERKMMASGRRTMSGTWWRRSPARRST